ncbi:hypothetical protein [Nocardia abscessus]|uniref:hypothetical protein n=1 Tax=Nocardia abscessus TaxID=120957 RepID=UPI0024583F7A|nr:hypothetical protein [Nocardia abscessus]
MLIENPMLDALSGVPHRDSAGFPGRQAFPSTRPWHGHDHARGTSARGTSVVLARRLLTTNAQGKAKVMWGKAFGFVWYAVSVAPDGDAGAVGAGSRMPTLPPSATPVIVVRPVADRYGHEVGASCAPDAEFEPGSTLWLLDRVPRPHSAPVIVHRPAYFAAMTRRVSHDHLRTAEQVIASRFECLGGAAESAR